MRNGRYEYHVGNARTLLRKLPDRHFQCCVTSPPYFGLRDYGVKNQIGLEDSPEKYVRRLVRVFSEVKRVLRDDGLLFLNLGDSYAASGMGGNPRESAHQKQATNRGSCEGEHVNRDRTAPEGYKPKDLMGMPWRVAFALQADGWILRNAIVWYKMNPMPSSVKDRFSSSYEMVFMFAKSEHYYFDAEAVKEESSGRVQARNRAQESSANSKYPKGRQFSEGVRVYGTEGTRNKRDVWSVPNAPYKGSHFACFPPKLIKPMILAGSSAKGCCPTCGAPWRRVLEKPQPPESMRNRGSSTKMAFHTQEVGSGQALMEWYAKNPAKTLGWYPTCSCSGLRRLPRVRAWFSDEVLAVVREKREALIARAKECERTPCRVLDPFGGSGTTACVSLEHRRDAVLLDLNPKYEKLARKRVRQHLAKVRAARSTAL